MVWYKSLVLLICYSVLPSISWENLDKTWNSMNTEYRLECTMRKILRALFHMNSMDSIFTKLQSFIIYLAISQINLFQLFSYDCCAFYHIVDSERMISFHTHANMIPCPPISMSGNCCCTCLQCQNITSEWRGWCKNHPTLGQKRK